MVLIEIINNLLLFGPAKEFASKTEGAKFYASNNSRSTYHTIFFFGILSLMPAGAIAEFLLDQSQKPFIAYLIVLLIFPLAGLIGIRKFLWLVKGKEHLEIDEEHLYVYKTGTFWTKKKKYELSKISNVRPRDEKDLEAVDPYIAKRIAKTRIMKRIILRMTVGEILFTYQRNDISYLKQVVYLFNYLSDEERQLVINEINKRLISGENG